MLRCTKGQSCIARVSTLAMLGLLLAHAMPCLAETLTHGPVIWHEDDRRPIAEPDERDPNLIWDMLEDSVFLPLSRNTQPGNVIRRVGTLFGGDHVRPAMNVNSLDEAPNSSWFTNRIGLFPLGAADVARGPGNGKGPDKSGPWTVISAKTQGVTPGFNIRDAAGGTYLIKFDPPGYLGMTSGAGVISNRIFFASGYNVPDDAVVVFRREDLMLGDGVKIKLEDGSKRAMSEADLDAILASVDALPDGGYHAISSKFIDGKPIGPFDYKGRRKDDPNDRVPHQHRRELRGLRIFAGWINHFDTKQHNSLDAFHGDGDGGKGHVVHYLIDFASTLGAGANGPTPRYGHEFTFDLLSILGRTFALGLYEDPWRRLQMPAGLDEIAFFSSDEFDPLGFDPLQPNSAFANCTDRDAYWAAKIISAFSDEHLAAICREAGYRNPAATDYVTRVLAERRDIIARKFFDRVAPLEFFQRIEGVVSWRDLGVERGIYSREQTRYRVRLANVGAEREIVDRSDWLESNNGSVALSARPNFDKGRSAGPPFVAVECQVDRGDGWSDSVTAYISQRHGKIVAMER